MQKSLHSGPSRNDGRAGARRTLLALVVTVSALVIGSVTFMVLEGRNRIPEGRPLLAILPFQGSTPGSSRYAGFGEGLAAYFSRMNPRDLGVLGPASTADRIAEVGGDALEVGRQFDADMILVGHEVTRGSTLVLVAELFRVDVGALLWSGEYPVGEPGELRLAQTTIGTEITQVLDLTR